MKTLLQPGDMIRIRNDISEAVEYHMILNTTSVNGWVKYEMAPAGKLITIKEVTDNGQYYVHYDSTDKEKEKRFCSMDFWHYTDEMFDPESIQILLEERINL